MSAAEPVRDGEGANIVGPRNEIPSLTIRRFRPRRYAEPEVVVRGRPDRGRRVGPRRVLVDAHLKIDPEVVAGPSTAKIPVLPK